MTTFVRSCMLALGITLGAEAAEPRYTINPGDVLRISVYKEAELNLEVLVQPDGLFTFPLAGVITAQGKSPAAVQAEIAKKIEKYITDAVVTVGVQQVQGNSVYVLGKVGRPGEFIMTHPITVMQALSMAGGTTSFASLNNIRILRAGGGNQVALRFRYNDVAQGEDLEQNITLQTGDVVVVP